MFGYVWWMTLCLNDHMYELPPSMSNVSAKKRLMLLRSEYPPWFASCMTENPTPATASPTEMLSSAACQA